LPSHTRLYVPFLVTVFFCALLSIAVQSQTTTRRVTVTTETQLNLNPSLSGDGKHIAFESTADISGSGGAAALRAVRANVAEATLSFSQIAVSRAPAPAISQDGRYVAFASKDDPLGLNSDGNQEVFYFDGEVLRQITDTKPLDAARRARDGNFQPSISDDGRLVAFASNRNLVGSNADSNLEIFLYDATTRQFTQLTNSSGVLGATDAKISGDGSSVAFIVDAGAVGSEASARRQLTIIDLRSGVSRVLAADVDGLTLAPGRAISDDGARVVYAASTAANATQVFLYDGRNNLLRQFTSLGARVTDVPLHPTISGDGSRIAFATRRDVIGGNSDASVELYIYDLPTRNFTRITNAPSSATAEVVSSLDDTGTTVAFNFPRILTDSLSSADYSNNPEIYIAAVAARPEFSSELTVLNGASLAKTVANVVAPDSIAVALGNNFSPAAAEARKLSDGFFPRSLSGTTVTVNGRAAQMFYVSPKQVNFHVPVETEIGTAQIVVRNLDGFETRGAVKIVPAAPGIFTVGGTGSGEAVALDAATLESAPFDATDGDGNATRLMLFMTGVAKASDVSIITGDNSLKVESITTSTDLPGLQQINVVLAPRLKGLGKVNIIARTSEAESNEATITVTNGGGIPRVAAVTLTPSLSSIPVGGTMQFRASAFDANGEEITDAAFTFAVSDAATATISATGVATGEKPGTTIITAASGGVSASAQLQIVSRTLVVNEVLADPPDGLSGDANYDGTRSGADDEFVELVNASDVALDISKWTIRTRALTGSIETLRHTFGADTLLPADEAIVIFGGGNVNPNDSRFGGAKVVEASTGGLSLTNSGLTLIIRDSFGNLVTQISYGRDNDNLGGDSVNGSITLSPDVTGILTRHPDAPRSAARRFSPGTKLDGTPFKSPPLSRIEISPSSASVEAGAKQLFEARAFNNVGGTEVPVPNVVFVWDSSNTARATLSPATGANTTVTAVSPGSVSIRARAGGIEGSSTLTITPPPPIVSSIDLTPESASVVAGSFATFTATARDSDGKPVPGISMVFSLRNPSPADTATITGASGNTVTIRGDKAGSVTVAASFTRPSDSVTVEDTSSLTINPPLPPIARIEVTPASVTIAAGETRQLTARAFASNNVEIPGVAFVWTTSNPNVVSVSGSGVATGVMEGNAEVVASAGGVISSPVSIIVLPPPIAGVGQVIINEAVVAIDSGNTQARDFVELYNTTSGTLDISGLLVSFRQSGASNTVLTVSLPGAVGSRTSLIGPQGYFLIANGTQAYGATADFDASSTNPPNGFNLNNTTGGLKIEIGGAKLDGLTYQGSSTAPPSIFLSFGEGAVLTFTGGTTNDLLRTPNGTDTNSNANDFRRNGTTASITPKRVNPTLP